MLEESDKGEEDEDFNLYLSDEEIENFLTENELADKNVDAIPLTYRKSYEPEKIVEKALIHDHPKYNRVQTRSQTVKDKVKLFEGSQELENKIEEIEDRNDPPDKESDIESNKGSESDEAKIADSKIRNRQTKPNITDIQTLKSNIIESRDLLFLRKDNVTYFVNIDGKPLDSGSQKLFERNEIPKLSPLTLGKAKAIKYKKHYHIALPINEGLREGPTMTLTQIAAAIKDLRDDHKRIESRYNKHRKNRYH